MGVVRLQNRKPYASAIDMGSRPHPIGEITAKNAKALRFTSSSGAVIFRKRVNVKRHPGNKPYRFLSRATTHAGSSFFQEMTLAMARIARRF